MYDCGCEDCKTQTHTLAIGESKIKPLLKAVETAFKQLHKKGNYKPEDLAKTKAYTNLVTETSQIFNGAITDNDIPEAMAKSLKEDVFVFSGLKTHAQLAEASKLLMTADGKIKSFSAFSKDVESIKENYNQKYLDAEYQFAVSSAQSAGNWANLSSDYDLQYRTAEDDRVRDSHEKLKVTLPQDDAFWISYYPPNGWRCRCTAVQVRKGKFDLGDSKKAIAEGEKATSQIDKYGKNKLAIFRFNPGVQKVVFPPTHPYSQVAGAKEVRQVIDKLQSENESEILNKNQYFQRAKERVQEYKLDKVYKSLTIDQSSSIHLYTQTDAFYNHINTYHRTGKVRLGARADGMNEDFIKAVSNNINQGLDNIPDRHKGMVYRGTRLDKEDLNVYEKAFKEKTSHIEKAFMSTTTDELRAFNGNTTFKIKAKNGAIIEKLSSMEDEKEVLFKTGQQFKVTKFERLEQEYEIHLEEL